MTSFLILAIASGPACRAGKETTRPIPIDTASKQYADVVQAFYIGLAALQVGEQVRAAEQLTEAARVVPDEPAAWANLGLLSLRQRELDAAAEHLEKARRLAPDSSQIHFLLGQLALSRGDQAKAIESFRKAVDLDASDVQAAYALAESLEQQGGDNALLQSQRLLEKIQQARPDNLAATVALAQTAARRGDAETSSRVVAQLTSHSAAWPPEAKQQLDALRAVAGTDPSEAAAKATGLANLLVREPEYRQGLSELKSSPADIAQPLTRFLRLPSPPTIAAPADDALAYSLEPLPEFGAGVWDWTGAALLSGEQKPVTIAANAREARLSGGARLSFAGANVSAATAPESVLAFDFNYDFKTDFALVGAGGLRLFQQNGKGGFGDVTAQAKLPASVTQGAYAGAWAADLESDGDLDLVLAAQAGPPVVLRNNGDGTFTQQVMFEGVSELRDFAWADLDGDGDADAALLDAQGRLQVFANERSGQFVSRPLPSAVGPAMAIRIADLDNDGALDVIVLQRDGAVRRLSDKSEGRDWQTAELCRWANAASQPASQAARLLIADLDNNGSLDVLVSGALDGAIWLGDERGRLQPLATSLPLARIFAAADVTDDGSLDLLGVSQSGAAVRLVSRPQRDYHWKEVRARAKQSQGDRRVNPFGVGGQVEIRAGLLLQRQPINGPAVHFGLGKTNDVDVVRILWPNGFVQAEFDVKGDLPYGAPVVFDQRLDGSCPFVFAYDGQQMSFVTDLIWRAPLGLREKAWETAPATQTADWIKIRGDQLVARNGLYDIRITADLWEAHYFDHVSLMVVDHPPGTEVFVDERYAATPAPLAVRATGLPRPVAGAWDDRGRNVADVVRERDRHYLDTFGRGPYIGVTRDHFVEVELPDEAPARGPLWLVACGWYHPTDSSTNVALAQGRTAVQDLRLEVPDGRGGWVVARPALGFPSDKDKTILINLDGVFRPGTPRRLRLRTNLEIYWDAIWWATAEPDSIYKVTRLSAQAAELAFRGISKIEQADESSPEQPLYHSVIGFTQRWRDLIGYYTRYGDVRELLANVDDRYVIMKAGDELRFLFAAPPPPPSGWQRDYVLIGDGWVKGGDFNTAFSKTVLPLPSHANADYTKPPGRLEDDPVYRRHAADWQNFHTRYVTPRDVETALRLPKRE
ncbi:MAG TPA: FG-GAP-like repeat-containing protein [Blastocatellia bacterium]|nr:FG-GAP-like repeat-containing protein [Blastocatellia bacterium]